MQKREAEFQTRLNKWMKYHIEALGLNAFWLEAKVSRTNSIPFSAVKDHQERSLKQAEEGYMYHKFSDAMRMGTPCDAIYTYKVGGIIALQYWKPQEKTFYLIPYKAWVKEKESSNRKSLTEERAREIGIICCFH